MKVLFLFFCAAVILSCNENKTSTTSSKLKSKYSTAFNKSIDSVMTAYYALSEAFVNWDSASLPSKATTMTQKLNIPLEELAETDSSGMAIKAVDLEGEVRENLTPIMLGASNDITVKRQAFNAVTNSLYQLLDLIKYDERKLFLHECTMPYNDTGSGVWLSDADTLRNPYLGLHHSRYGSGMISCGSLKSTIDYTSKEK